MFTFFLLKNNIFENIIFKKKKYLNFFQIIGKGIFKKNLNQQNYFF